MSKKTPKPKAPYKGSSQRFGDWNMDNIIPMEPGQILVNDDPEGDPNKFAYHGRENPHLPKKPLK